MSLLAYLRSIGRKFFRRSRLDSEMEEELRAHIEHRADDLERSGLRRAVAERRARIEFGGHARFQEESRDSLGGNFVETVIQDLRFSIRILRKSPGFAIVAALTLALAIGANSVVFGVLNALILRPLNVPEPQSLYGIERGNDKAVNHSYPDYLDLRARNRSFEDLAAYNVVSVGFDSGHNPASTWILEVTGNYFDALRIQPYLGRFFHTADERGPDSASYIVLNYAFWRSHFHGDRTVVGRVALVNKHPFTILGVAPPEFHGTLTFLGPDFWVPLVNQQQVEGQYVLNQRGNRDLLMVLGHLKRGVTRAQAISDLNSVGAYLEKMYTKDDGNMTFSLARPSLAGDWLGSPVRAFLSGLMLLAGLILLAACANLGSLFAARAADRSREIAVRLALGSGPARILRQLFTEAVLISLVGGAIGLWGSVLLLDALSLWEPLPTAPLRIPVNPDANVYGLALLLSLASGFVFGAVPVKQVLRTDPYRVIRLGSTGTAGRRITARDLLLAAQIAICALLVTSSMVAVRGLARSLDSNFGFEPQNATLVETALSMAGYEGDRVPAIQKRIIDALQAIPGVESVGLVDRPPLYYGANESTIFSDKTADLRPANAAGAAAMYRISPEYFDAARTTILAGRRLSWHDNKGSPRVAVVNREFAMKMFGSAASAVGRYYKMPDGSRVEVVGIVADGKYENLAEDPMPAMFLPILQSPSSQMCLIVRSKRSLQELAGSIKATVRGVDAGLPFLIHPWSLELESALFASRMATLSLGVLGMMGAMLSITGIFGMAAYSVSRRLKELGIRVALGAKRNEVLRSALGRALRLLAFGSAAGLILGILASRVLSGIVYQATPRDPLVLAGVVFAMLLLGLAATWIPAQRVLSIHPMALLREE